MRKNTRLILIRRFVLAALILLAAILQNTRGFFPEPFGIRAFLLIPLTVSVSMFERSYAGVLFGILAGALWDSVSVAWNGFNALFLMLTAAGCGLLITLLMRNHLLTAVILSGSASLLYCLFYILLFITAKGLGDAGYLLVRYYLPEAVYTTLFTPVFYLFVKAVMRVTATEEAY